MDDRTWHCLHCDGTMLRGDAEHDCAASGAFRAFRVLRRSANAARGDGWSVIREAVDAHSPREAIARAGYLATADAHAFAPGDLRR